MLFSLTNPEVAIMMMGIFLFAVLLGFPIAFTLMAMGIGFGYYAYYDPAVMEHFLDNRIFQLFVQNTYTVMDNNVLTAVPLFLFMGYLVERAGIVAEVRKREYYEKPAQKRQRKKKEAIRREQINQQNNNTLARPRLY